MGDSYDYRLRATLADGRVLIGWLQGSGGYLGAGYSQLPAKEIQALVMARIARSQSARAQDPEARISIRESAPGLVIFVETEGERHAIPILGTTFAIEPWTPPPPVDPPAAPAPKRRKR